LKEFYPRQTTAWETANHREKALNPRQEIVPAALAQHMKYPAIAVNTQLTSSGKQIGK
jgi:hypothetical protein